MTILIGKYEFNGPYYSVTKLEEKPGLFAVLHQEGENFQLIHLTQSKNIRESIELSAPYKISDSALLTACYLEGYSTRARISILEEILLEFEDGGEENLKVEQLTKSAS